MSREYQKEYLVSVGERPWGTYYVLANEEDHKVKRIHVNAHARLSLQYHQYREEHWFIQKGRATVTIDNKKIVLVQGESINIPRTALHRIANEASEPLVFIEVQTGDYFGEDDISRVEDDYIREDVIQKELSDIDG